MEDAARRVRVEDDLDDADARIEGEKYEKKGDAKLHNIKSVRDHGSGGGAFASSIGRLDARGRFHVGKFR